MKKALLLVIFIILFSSHSLAQTMYVSDKIEITLRTGPSIGHKIVKMLNTGEKLEVIEPGPEWAKVRISSGMEGWVLNRYLAAEKPSRLVLESVGKKNEEILSQLSDLKSENSTLKEERKSLSSELEETKKNLKEISQAYEDLKGSASTFLKLESDYKGVTQQLAEQTKKNEKLEKENIQNYVKAGLCGSGVLLLGFIIGYAMKSQRRRSSLLS